MRQFTLHVIERRKTYTDQVDTHPMEVGWASEAIFFIRLDEVHGDDPELKLKVQISADGINWMDEGTEFSPIKKDGHHFVRVSHFGGWLRLAGEVTGEESRYIVTVQLVLKE